MALTPTSGNEGPQWLKPRLMETLIIELYARRGWIHDVQDPDTNEFLMLKALIGKLTGDSRLRMQRRTIEGLEKVKELGDTASHDFKDPESEKPTWIGSSRRCVSRVSELYSQSANQRRRFRRQSWLVAIDRSFALRSLGGRPSRKIALLIFAARLHDTQYWAEWSQPMDCCVLRNCLRGEGIGRRGFTISLRRTPVARSGSTG